MALPYDGLLPSDFVADPALNPGMDVAPVLPAFPNTEDFLAATEADLAAEEAARAAPPPNVMMEPEPSDPVDPVDFAEAEAAKRRFEELAYQGVPVEPELDAEIMGEFQPNVDAIAARQIAPPQPRTTFDATGTPIAMGGAPEPSGGFQDDGPLGVDSALNLDQIGAPIIPELEESAPVPVQDLSDEALQMRAFDIQQAEKAEKERLAAEEAERDAKLKARNAQVYQRKLAEADKRSEELFQRAQELGRRKVDGGRYMDNMSLGQKAGSLLSILAGGQLGLISGRGGNEALDFFQRQINQDIDLQKYNLENDKENLRTQQGLVGELYRQTGNAFEAAETARLAMYEAAISEIDAQVARMDPMGSQAVEREIFKRGLQAQAQAQRAKVLEAQRAQAMADAKLEIDAADTQSQIDERRAKIDKMRAETAKLNRRGRGSGKKALDPGLQARLISQGFKPYLDGNGLLIRDPSYDGTPADPKEAAELRKALAEAERAEREVGIETLGAANITDKDGNPIKFQDKAVAVDVSKSYGATRLGLELIDDMLAAIEKHGWSSDTLKSDEWQRAQANQGQLTLVYKDTEKLGALAGADVELVDKTSGTQGDITGIRDPSAGLKQARANLIKKFNLTVQGYRPEAKPVDFPKRTPAKAPEKLSSMSARQAAVVPTKGGMYEGDEEGDIAHRKQLLKEANPKNQIRIREIAEDLYSHVKTGQIPLKVAQQSIEDFAPRYAKARLKSGDSIYEGMSAEQAAQHKEDLENVAKGIGTYAERWKVLTEGLD